MRLTKQDAKKAKDKLDCESKDISTTLTVLAALRQKKPESYWVFSMASSQQELSMIVHLLAPESGMISKGKQDLWHYIEEKLVPMLSKVVVDAKGEEYMQHLATVTAELAALNDQEEALESPLDTTENRPRTAGESVIEHREIGDEQEA